MLLPAYSSLDFEHVDSLELWKLYAKICNLLLVLKENDN